MPRGNLFESFIKYGIVCLQDSESGSRKLKRKYEKKKHKSGSSQSAYRAGGEVVDVIEYGSTEDEPLSPVC